MRFWTSRMKEEPTSDEARKVCEEAENYMRQIRCKELRFTDGAMKLTRFDRSAEGSVPLPDYAYKRMEEYRDLKVEEAEYVTRIEAPKTDLEFVNFDARKYREMLRSVRRTRFLVACNFLRAMDQALTRPTAALTEGEAFFAKLEKCEKEKNELIEERDLQKRELERVSTELVSVNALYEKCLERERKGGNVRFGTGN